MLFVYERFVFFFKQKTAYEMRISDWSSDVCSSDLSVAAHQIAFNVVALLFMVPLGIGTAATVRIGMAAGANDMPRVRRAGLAAMGISQIGRASCRERVCQYV